MERASDELLRAQEVYFSDDDDDRLYESLFSKKVYLTEKQIDNIVKKHYHENVLAVDMESAAVAHACYLTNTPYMIMRVISDVIGEESQITSYYEFSTAACKASVEAIINLIN